VFGLGGGFFCCFFGFWWGGGVGLLPLGFFTGVDCCLWGCLLGVGFLFVVCLVFCWGFCFWLGLFGCGGGGGLENTLP